MILGLKTVGLSVCLKISNRSLNILLHQVPFNKLLFMNQVMRNVHIFQIFYNEETRNSLDPGFLPLDNGNNSRSDWREYWPIRNYLLNNTLNEDDLYGFFSPKFKLKTGLSSSDCYSFINNHSNDLDVIAFSPFFDIGAFFQNSFLQCIAQHPNSRYAVENSLKLITPSLDINEIVMHSDNNIFCNYFVAKPKFWKVWLKTCEMIWSECELNTSHLAKELNSPATGHDSDAPIKTFIIEKIASLLLATDTSWHVEVYDPFKLPFSNARISHEKSALIQMDALKIAYASQKRPEYLNLFHSIRNLLEKKLG